MNYSTQKNILSRGQPDLLDLKLLVKVRYENWNFEKKNFLDQIDQLNDNKSIFDFTITFLEHKISNLYSEVDQEKSKNEIMSFEQKKTKKNYEELLKTFKKRNEIYEKVLNEFYETNSKIHERKQQKIKKIKTNFQLKLDKFLKTKKSNKSINKENDELSFFDKIKSSMQILTFNKSSSNSEKDIKTIKEEEVESSEEYISDKNTKTKYKNKALIQFKGKKLNLSNWESDFEHEEELKGILTKNFQSDDEEEQEERIFLSRQFELKK